MKIQASLLSKIIPEYYTSQAWLDTEKKNPQKNKKKYMISYNPSQKSKLKPCILNSSADIIRENLNQCHQTHHKKRIIKKAFKR